MHRCYQCGNSYDKCFTVSYKGAQYHFDCFECAIQALAPSCSHCDVRVIGHGVEGHGQIFCCAHCATVEGVSGLHDRKYKRSEDFNRGVEDYIVSQP